MPSRPARSAGVHHPAERAAEWGGEEAVQGFAVPAVPQAPGLRSVARRGAGRAHHGSEVRRPGVGSPAGHVRRRVQHHRRPRGGGRRRPGAGSHGQGGGRPAAGAGHRARAAGRRGRQARPAHLPAALLPAAALRGARHPLHRLPAAPLGLRRSAPRPLSARRARALEDAAGVAAPGLGPATSSRYELGRVHLMPLGTLHFDPRPHPSRPRAAPAASRESEALGGCRGSPSSWSRGTVLLPWWRFSSVGSGTSRGAFLRTAHRPGPGSLPRRQLTSLLCPRGRQEERAASRARS